MLSDFAVNKYLHTVASRWNILIYSYDPGTINVKFT